MAEHFSIRPAARHVFTIGEGLIKDNYSALTEIVKNSYDADATWVHITFAAIGAHAKPDQNHLRITVEDDGHGMSYDHVVGVWMVPSTTDKVGKDKSLSGRRPLQGRKGIGRYAASILGDQLGLETTQTRETTRLKIRWSDFAKPVYLDDVRIPIERKSTSKSDGTTLTIDGSSAQLLEWDSAQVESLIKELKKLMSPIHEFEEDDPFAIRITFKEFPVAEFRNQELEIEPFPLLKLYDYRIHGTVSRTGKADLVFENHAAKGIRPEAISSQVGVRRGKYCGNISIDLRVYDRDAVSIDHLISRGLRNPVSGAPLGRAEAKNILNDNCGIGVYRNGFRIRPHGDPGYDWLTLDRKRVQEPSLRVGSDQVIGYIGIEPEDQSHLIEKASREGLKENLYYEGLVEIVGSVLTMLQQRRFSFKRRTGKSRGRKAINQQLESAFDFSEVSDSIDQELASLGVTKERAKRIALLLEGKAQEGQKALEAIQTTIATYQGQATLGKIMKVVLHEARNPLSFFKNQVLTLNESISTLRAKPDKNTLDQIVERLVLIREQSGMLIDLFHKLNPLAAKRPSKPKDFSVRSVLLNSLAIFERELSRYDIKVGLTCDAKVTYLGHAEDLQIALTNLMDNSIYWLQEKEGNKRRIDIGVSKEADDVIVINYLDSGPGIEKQFIDDESIFEPGFSSKSEGSGTGLGLAIAGDAMERNQGRLSAVYNEEGAHFVLELGRPKSTIDDD